MPEVTVLMPVYNAEGYLRQSIDSILLQRYPDFELLIINDGSTDASRKIILSCEDPRIRLIDNETNLGLVPSLNRGLSLARGTLVARQDADDISHPLRLERQVEYLRRHPEIALLGTQGRLIDQDGRPTGKLDKPQESVSIRWFQLFDNSFIHTSVMFRQEIICGEFKGYPSFLHCEDYELWSRVVLAHPVANLPERLVDYRIHPSSIISSLAGEPARGTAARIRCINRKNLLTVFTTRRFSEEDLDRIALMRAGIDEKSLTSTLELFHALLWDFQQLFPESQDSRDFCRTLALQYTRLAYSLLPINRLLAYRLFLRGLNYHLGLASSLPLLRILALTLLGERARRSYRLFRALGRTVKN